jgi:Domain of unknown function (DUF4145)
MEEIVMADIYKKRFAELEEQMRELLASQKVIYDQPGGGGKLNIEYNDLLGWRVKVLNLLNKACGKDSEHYNIFNNVHPPYLNCLQVLERLSSIFLAAKEDYEGGYLKSARSLIQAEVFDSELEQASELYKAGYVSAAAIVAGVVLETALRESCGQAGIPHGKLDKMNADLAKAGIYNKNQQKLITRLAGLRNSAAHGKPEEFTKKDIESMIRDVESFLARHL